MSPLEKVAGSLSENHENENQWENHIFFTFSHGVNIKWHFKGGFFLKGAL